MLLSGSQIMRCELCLISISYYHSYNSHSILSTLLDNLLNVFIRVSSHLVAIIF